MSCFGTGDFLRQKNGCRDTSSPLPRLPTAADWDIPAANDLAADFPELPLLSQLSSSSNSTPSVEASMAARDLQRNFQPSSVFQRRGTRSGTRKNVYRSGVPSRWMRLFDAWVHCCLACKTQNVI
jgi:hypothetical protein